MRRLVVVVCLLLVLAPAAADEKKSPPNPVEQAADSVLEALKTNDDEKLAALAASDKPDPWIVADELCYREKPAAALAFAEAAPRADTESLPAYVKAWKARADEKAAREALTVYVATARTDVLEDLEGDAETVTGLRLLFNKSLLAARAGQAQVGAAGLQRFAEGCAKIGWIAKAAHGYGGLSYVLSRAGDPAAAVVATKKEIEIQERRPWTPRLDAVIENLGILYRRIGRFDDAARAFERGIAMARKRKDDVRLSKALLGLGSLYQAIGKVEPALRIQTEARDLAEKSGNWLTVASVDRNLGSMQAALGRHDKALAIYGRGLEIARAHGISEKIIVDFELAEVWSLVNLGRHDEAIPRLKRGLAWARTAKNAGMERRALEAYAHLHANRGELALTLSYREKALQAAQRRGDIQRVVLLLGALARDHYNVGQLERAAEYSRQCVAKATALGAARPHANALLMLGELAWARGDDENAAKHALEALKIARQARLLDIESGCLSLAGRALIFAGRMSEGRALLEEAIAREGKGASPKDVYDALTTLGRGLIVAGKPADALPYLEKARDFVDVTGSDVDLHILELNVAMAKLDSGDYAGAVEAAKRSVAVLGTVVGGFAHEESAQARQKFATIYELGAKAAAGAGDLEAMYYFLESGRGGALLEALGGRATLRKIALPEAWAQREDAARAAVAAATRRFAGAKSSGDFKAARSAREALSEARKASRTVLAQMEREKRAIAGLVYPRPPPLAEVRKQLSEDEALVLYGFFSGASWALVAMRDDARVVELAAKSAVEPAVGALLDEGAFLSDRAAEAMRGLVAKPLGLSTAVKRIVLSPDGALAYAPPSLLFPEREVVAVPSAGTRQQLVETATARGDGVLAVGDPEYRDSRGLMPLPDSAAEIEAIGTVRIGGKDATEVRARAEIAKRPRWRAVHFACHGLIDEKRPLDSALALTIADEDDGMLTAAELLGIDVPADLVVLSACDTARGRIYEAEGVVGLTRAFMFAGAPRVICSLWKVDDEATRALMIRFYELWAKDVSAAAALRGAQEHVRTFERTAVDPEASHEAGRTVTKRSTPWAHPRYWAAWVLWGLP